MHSDTAIFETDKQYAFDLQQNTKMVIIILEREKHALKVNIKSIVMFVIECTFYEKNTVEKYRDPTYRN